MVPAVTAPIDSARPLRGTRTHIFRAAAPTGFEPAISCVTGR